MDPAPVARVQLLDGFGLEFGRCGGGVHDGLPRGVQRLVALLGVSRQPTRTAVAGLLWPDVPEVHAQGSLRSALRYQAKAIDRAPEDWRLWVTSARLKIKAGDVRGAESDLKRARRLNPRAQTLAREPR